MKNRLSQRVYSEPALEFWLRRLGADWERQFSGQELDDGRRLYRTGAVRQVELGNTDAIVHMRLADQSEAYVVLDWEKPLLNIRASVNEQSLRRTLAVAGLYEVEELVGDEVADVEPESAANATAAQTGQTAPDGQTKPSENAGGTPTLSSQHAGAARSGHQSTGSDAAAAGRNNSATAHHASAGSLADTVSRGNQQSSGSADRTGAHADGKNSRNTAGSRLSIFTAADAGTSATGESTAGSAETATTAATTTAAATGKAQQQPERELSLHFSLRQGGLMLKASWRQQGRRKLTPALGEEAPSAESMTVAEREALIRLASLARRAGFRYDKAAGGYRMGNADQMERFVGRELGGWAELFSISQDADVALLARGVQEVSLKARVDQDADGSLSLEWVARFDAAADSASDERSHLSAAERRRLLRSGAEPLLLPGRGLVRLSEKQARASERLSDAVSLFPSGHAPRYLLFSLVGLGDLPVEISASLQRWRQAVIGGMRHSTAAAAGGAEHLPAPAPSSGEGFPAFLRSYQRIGVSWMRHLFERDCHGLLADEMGLGKTVQVLTLIAGIVEAGKRDSAQRKNGTQATAPAPSLVVCPASVVPVWQAQAEQFFPDLSVKVLGAGCTFATEAAAGTVPDLWVASYTQLRRHKSLLEQVQFACAVLDEAQFIKNPEAKVTQACLSLKAERRLALSGTPLENRYLDVWTLFRFLMPGLLGSRRRFEEALAADEPKHLATLRRQLSPFILRRTKGEVASELPEKVELDLVCPLTDLQRGEYRRLLAEGVALQRPYEEAGHDATGRPSSVASAAADAVPSAPASTRPALAPDAAVVAEAEGAEALPSSGAAAAEPTLMSILTLLTRLRQVACDPGLLPWMPADLHHSGKLNLLRDRLGEVFANGKKAVVFSQFVKFLDRAKQAIASDYPDVPIYELTGATRDRGSAVSKFQAQEGAAVFLVSLRAGGTGITLHAADYVFLLDPWWNPAVEEQAIDRVHRIGQVNRVFVYRMVTAETVEARVAALKQQKRERFEQIVSGASQGDDFREAFRSLESLLGLLRDSDVPQKAAEPVTVS